MINKMVAERRTQTEQTKRIWTKTSFLTARVHSFTMSKKPVTPCLRF